MYVDVGGGSTEINLISNGELKNSRSYNIGTVRMLSGMVKEEEKEALRTALIGLATEYTPISVIGSGGNINKLFRITTLDNYQGKLFEKIGVGTTEKELLEVEPSFVYDDFEEVWESEKGIFIEMDAETNTVRWISVYIRELDDENFENANW